MSKAWMPIYIGDYLADTQHLTTLQHGAYLLLIMHYWQRGGLPNNEQAIAGICRLNRTQWESNCQAIAKLFLPGWKHKRIDLELEKARIVSEKRALAGQKGGRFNRGKSNGERFETKAIAEQTVAQSQSLIESSSSQSVREVPKEQPKKGIQVSQSLIETMRRKEEIARYG